MSFLILNRLLLLAPQSAEHFLYIVAALLFMLQKAYLTLALRIELSVQRSQILQKYAPPLNHVIESLPQHLLIDFCLLLEHLDLVIIDKLHLLFELALVGLQ